MYINFGNGMIQNYPEISHSFNYIYHTSIKQTSEESRLYVLFMIIKLLQLINTWPALNCLNQHNNVCTANSKNVLVTLFMLTFNNTITVSQNICYHIRNISCVYALKCIKMSLYM